LGQHGLKAADDEVHLEDNIRDLAAGTQHRWKRLITKCNSMKICDSRPGLQGVGQIMDELVIN